MQLHTKGHGVINYETKDIITFPKGLPGFTNLKEFILFPIEENKSFKVLHSIEDEQIGLIAVSPFEFLKDYEFSLKEEAIKTLEIKDSEEVMVINIVTLNRDPKKITVNLKAPVIINVKSGVAMQLILDKEKYKIKHPLIEE